MEVYECKGHSLWKKLLRILFSAFHRTAKKLPRYSVLFSRALEQYLPKLLLLTSGYPVGTFATKDGSFQPGFVVTVPTPD